MIGEKMFDILAFFDAKFQFTPSILWIVGGFVSGIGIIIGTVVKVMTRNHVHRKEAFKTFQTTNLCDERYKNIDSKFDNLKDHISNRFDDLKSLIRESRR